VIAPIVVAHDLALPEMVNQLNIQAQAYRDDLEEDAGNAFVDEVNQMFEAQGNSPQYTNWLAGRTATPELQREFFAHQLQRIRQVYFKHKGA
jgi:hypothetical protein